MKERFGVMKIGGKDITLLGEDIQVGQKAPEFFAQTQDWETIQILATTSGKVRIIAALPSIETSVCDRESRRFNEEASALGEEIVVITISTDLPTTQARWCGAAGIERIMMVSDHMETDFGQKYGCLVKERRNLRRAVFVVDAEDKVVYADYMPTLGDEPDYDAVLQAARRALK